jgi:hypothetical protein
MRNWIFSTQSNVVVVAVAYACSLFFIGDTPFEVKEPSAAGVPKPAYVSVESPSLLVGAELERAVKFHSLTAQWRAERSSFSWVSDVAMCPAYQNIIGMGESALPFILAELESEGNEPDHWFWALRAITNVDPVPEEDRGDIVRMAAAWLDWGRNGEYAG